MMADEWLSSEPNGSCSGDLDRASCDLTESQVCRGGVYGYMGSLASWGGGGVEEGGRQLIKLCIGLAME